MKYVTFYTELLARNSYLDKSVENYLEYLLNKAANNKVKKYIKSNIKKYLINDYTGTLVEKIEKSFPKSPQWLNDALDKGEEVYLVRLTQNDRDKINHWIDYLNTLEESKDLSRISIPQLVKHVKEWDKSFAKNKADEEDGIKVIKEYPDKYKLFILLLLDNNSLKNLFLSSIDTNLSFKLIILQYLNSYPFILVYLIYSLLRKSSRYFIYFSTGGSLFLPLICSISFSLNLYSIVI